MSYETFAVTAPAGVVDLYCVKLEHETWSGPLRYVLDTRDWTIPGDGVYSGTGLDIDAPGTDDTGIDSRGVAVPDLDFTLMRRLEKLGRTGNNVPVTVTVKVYLSNDLSTPALTAAVFNMANPTRDGRMVSFEASTVDTINRDAPSSKFTWANSPGLRR